MNEPIKPRIDFDGPLETEKSQTLKSARAFDARRCDKPSLPMLPEMVAEEEGAAGSGGGIGTAPETQPVAADG